MKVLHVAPLFTPNGVYGGPTRVAVNQAHALMENGHDVTIAGGVSGYETVPRAIEEVPARLFPIQRVVPRTGFAGLRARGLVAMLRTEIKNFDVVHVHLARDFVTLPSARMALKARVPLVAQCHGMVDVSDKLLAKPVDRFWTRKVLTSAHRVLYLTNTERERVAELAGDAVRFAFVPNGVPEYNMVDSSVSDDHAGPEVLFLARLHPRKRPEMFAKVGGVLLAEGVKARFTIIGPDGGSEEAVDRQISTQSILGGQTVRRMPAISPEDCATRIAQATIYVLPSINEPYPMSVLEAMSVGRPVIVTESCGLASAVKQHRCGVVVGESEDELRVAVRYLLTHKVEAEEMGRRGQDAVRRVFGMKPVVTKLEAVYSAASTSVESLLDEATCKTAQSDGK